MEAFENIHSAETQFHNQYPQNKSGQLPPLQLALTANPRGWPSQKPKKILEGVVLLFLQLAFHVERHQARASIRGLVAFLTLHDLMRYL